jgi:mannitol-1-phosphate 5-dehydrogenase
MASQNIVIFGAGKIGRSFVGQLFGMAGYEVIFVDMDEFLVNELNRRGSYPVVIKGPDREKQLVIKNVKAIHANRRNDVAESIRNAGIMAISVGKSALPAVASIVAEGLVRRQESHPGVVLDIILAENMRSADLFFGKRLREYLPRSFPLENQVGLVETSIGKMVPMMTDRDLEEDFLQVFAEPYNTLILDKQGFKGEIPELEELALKENMKAWVDRKVFIHNLGHTSAAYFGHYLLPDAKYMYEVLSHKKVLEFTRELMQEAARILRSAYPSEFSAEELTEHIHDLLQRFQNRSLGDTIYRVGCDIGRKLGSDDRFMATIRLAMDQNQAFDMILEAMAMGFHFKATGENNQMFPADIEFHSRVRADLDLVLQDICGLDRANDALMITQLKSRIEKYAKVSYNRPGINVPGDTSKPGWP